MRKWKFLFIFLCELPLILGLGGKLKNARDICERTLDIYFERDRFNGLDSTFGDRLTHTHTHTHTHTPHTPHTQRLFCKTLF